MAHAPLPYHHGTDFIRQRVQWIFLFFIFDVTVDNTISSMIKLLINNLLIRLLTKTYGTLRNYYKWIPTYSTKSSKINKNTSNTYY